MGNRQVKTQAKRTEFRPLNWTLHVKDRSTMVPFLLEGLKMKVLNQEIEEEGTERLSKTTLGYAPESDGVSLVLLYNYGGEDDIEGTNTLAHIEISAPKSLVDHVRSSKYMSYDTMEKDLLVLSPEGYEFVIKEDSNAKIPQISAARVRTKNALKTMKLYTEALGMAECWNNNYARVCVKDEGKIPFCVQFTEILGDELLHTEAKHGLTVAVNDINPLMKYATRDGKSTIDENQGLKKMVLENIGGGEIVILEKNAGEISADYNPRAKGEVLEDILKEKHRNTILEETMESFTQGNQATAKDYRRSASQERKKRSHKSKVSKITIR